MRKSHNPTWATVGILVVFAAFFAWAITTRYQVVGLNNRPMPIQLKCSKVLTTDNSGEYLLCERIKP